MHTGAATSRAEIARAMAISPSTAAARIDELIALGVLRAAGPGESQGGRPPQRVEIASGSGVVGTADLGTDNMTLAVFDMSGALIAERHNEIVIADGPDAILPRVLAQLHELTGGQELRGIGIALPGPVSTAGRLVSPSRMPGWNGVDVAARMNELAGVPVLADNDANLMAIGEHSTVPATKELVFVKAGSGIGCGIIADGHIYRGSGGMAGDISHASVSVPDAGHVLCSCGRYDCLDAIASEAAIVTGLRAAGVPVEDPADVIRLARDAHPLATRTLREAGTRTGNVLATIVNFFNPELLVLGGNLSQAEAFVAGVRSAIYTQCLPMATDHLEIAVSRAGTIAGVRGAAQLILDHLLFDSDVTVNRPSGRGVPAAE
ncbi:ROK family protein [Humibacter antri]